MVVKKHLLAGFTLIELMLTLVIVAILASIALPSYQSYIDKTNNTLAMADIKTIEGMIELSFVTHNQLPLDLSEFSIGDDPWGKPYQYLNMSQVKGNGKKRKNKNLVPVNSDYDLYSMGKDGKSTSPFTAKSSHDDIVRANNGGFIGKVEDY